MDNSGTGGGITFIQDKITRSGTTAGTMFYFSQASCSNFWVDFQQCDISNNCANTNAVTAVWFEDDECATHLVMDNSIVRDFNGNTSDVGIYMANNDGP